MIPIFVPFLHRVYLMPKLVMSIMNTRSRVMMSKWKWPSIVDNKKYSINSEEIFLNRRRHLSNMEILVGLASEKFRGPPIARSTPAVHRPSHHNEHVSNLWCTVVVPCGSAHSHSRARPWFMPLVKQPLEATGPRRKIISYFYTTWNASRGAPHAPPCPSFKLSCHDPNFPFPSVPFSGPWIFRNKFSSPASGPWNITSQRF